MFLTVKGTNTVYFSISIKFLSISMLVQPKTNGPQDDIQREIKVYMLF